MSDMLKNIKEQSPSMVAMLVAMFFGKSFIEGKITSVNKRIDQVSAASLRVKTDLRSVERDALVEFRQALVVWEHELFKGPSMLLSDEVSVATINEFYEKADEAELAVKVAWAKLSVLISKPKADIFVLDTIVKVRQTLLPPMKEITNESIDLRAELESIDTLLQPIYVAEKKGPLTPEMQEEGQALVERTKKANARRTELMRVASEKQLELYPPLIEALADLKEVSRAIVYRKLESDQIGED